MGIIKILIKKFPYQPFECCCPRSSKIMIKNTFFYVFKQRMHSCATMVSFRGPNHHPRSPTSLIMLLLKQRMGCWVILMLFQSPRERQSTIRFGPISKKLLHGLMINTSKFFWQSSRFCALAFTYPGKLDTGLNYAASVGLDDRDVIPIAKTM